MASGSRTRWREAGRVAVVAAGAALPVLAALRSLLPHFASSVALENVDVRLVMTFLEWGAGRWAAGLRGFWDAPFFFPTPGTMALSDHLLLPAAIHALVRGLGGSPALGYNLLLVSSFALTAAATYLLMRSALRVRPALAAALALAVVYAPWRWGQAVHLQMLWAPGPPLAILAFDRLLFRPRPGRALAFGVAYAVTLMSGCYLAYFTHAVLASILALRLGRTTDRARFAKRWRMLSVTAVACLAVGCAVFLPYVRENRALGLERPAATMLGFGARPTDWLAPSSWNVYSGTVPASWRRSEAALFPGFLLAAGALAGLARASRRRRQPLPLPILGRALLVAGAALALVARGAVYVHLAEVIPGLDGMRVPTRVQFFVLLAFAVLAGRSARALLAARASPRKRVWIALAIPALLLPDLWVKPVPARWLFEPEGPGDLPPHDRWLGVQDVRAVAYWPLGGGDVEVTRMWRALFHHRPIANGHSGYLTPSYLSLRRACRALSRGVSRRCVEAVAKLGVSHLVVEDAYHGPAPGDAAARAGTVLGPRVATSLRLVFADEQALVFALGNDGTGAGHHRGARRPQRRAGPRKEDS